jgi:hypothetical protein
VQIPHVQLAISPAPIGRWRGHQWRQEYQVIEIWLVATGFATDALPTARAPDPQRAKAMRLRDHFSAYLEQVQQEDRYRGFVDLERRAARPTFAV